MGAQARARSGGTAVPRDPGDVAPAGIILLTVRATTPGTFLAAPAKAEEMYSPEVFGRSIGAAVVIE